MRWFLAVRRSFSHSSLLYTLSFHTFPPTILPFFLTSSCYLFLGLPHSLVVPKFIYNTLLGILFPSILCTCPNQHNLFNLTVHARENFVLFMYNHCISCLSLCHHIVQPQTLCMPYAVQIRGKMTSLSVCNILEASCHVSWEYARFLASPRSISLPADSHRYGRIACVLLIYIFFALGDYVT